MDFFVSTEPIKWEMDPSHGLLLSIEKVFKKITEHALTLFHNIQLYIQSGLEACSGQDWGFMKWWDSFKANLAA